MQLPHPFFSCYGSQSICAGHVFHHPLPVYGHHILSVSFFLDSLPPLCESFLSGEFSVLNPAFMKNLTHRPSFSPPPPPRCGSPLYYGRISPFPLQPTWFSELNFRFSQINVSIPLLLVLADLLGFPFLDSSAFSLFLVISVFCLFVRWFALALPDLIESLFPISFSANLFCLPSLLLDSIHHYH